MSGRADAAFSGPGRPLAWAVLPLLCVISVGQSTPLAEREIVAFRESYSRIDPDYSTAAQAQAKVTAKAFDAVVTALLNSHAPMETIGAALASLPGSNVWTASAVTGADVVAEWPEYRSAYSLFSLQHDVTPTWAAVSGFGGKGWTVGHLAVFERSGTTWRLADAFDAESRLYAYPVRGSRIPAVAVIEHDMAADGWIGSFQLWQVNRSRLSKAGQQYEPLRFYEVQRGADGPKVNYSEFAKCLGVSVSQLRLNAFELSVNTVQGAPDVRTRTTTPWVAAVDDACSAVHAGKSASIAEPARATGSRVLRPDYVMLWEAEGDEKTGKGWVTVTSDAQKFFRFDVSRSAKGIWNIVRVAETVSR